MYTVYQSVLFSLSHLMSRHFTQELFTLMGSTIVWQQFTNEGYDSPHMDVIKFDIYGWVQEDGTKSVKLHKMHVVNWIRNRIDE